MRDPKNDAGPVLETDPRDNQSSTTETVAAENTAAKRRAWLDDVVREADERWHARHLLPLAALALGALRR